MEEEENTCYDCRGTGIGYPVDYPCRVCGGTGTLSNYEPDEPDEPDYDLDYLADKAAEAYENSRISRYE